MKKSLLALAVGMLFSASVANAQEKTVYFVNSDNWSNVYAYTEEPEDGAPFAELTEKTQIPGGPEVYSKKTEKGYIIFLNQKSFTKEPLSKTNTLAATNGNIYNAASELVGTYVDGVYKEVNANDVITVNTGVYLVGSMTNNALDADYQFSYSNSAGYFLYDVTLEDGAKFHIVKGAKAFGPIVAGNEITPSVDETPVSYDFSENTNDMTASGLYGVNLTLDFNAGETGGSLKVGKAEGVAPTVNWYGAFNVNSAWTLAGQFEDNKISIPVGDNTNFGIFRAVGIQSWKEGTQMAAAAGATFVTLGEAYDLTAAAGTFTLNNDVKVGNWVVTLADGKVTFAQEGQAILVDNAATEGATYTGALAKGQAIEAFNNGVLYTLAIEGEASVVDGKATINYTLVEATADNVYAFPYNSDAAAITVNFAAKTAKIVANNVGANVILVGSQSYKLVDGTANVTLTPNAAISFEIDGKRYICQYPKEAEAIDGKDVGLKVEDGKADVTLVESDAAATPWTFIKKNTTATVTVSGTTATFTWDKETGVDAIEADNNGEAVYFNLQGVKVANPEHGIFIEVKGGKAVKVVK